ncbi:MAG: hypothetical protein Q9201_007833 [Fulgogasparrea decipioides]
MSDSSLSDAPLPDIALEKALRDAVKRIYKEDPEQLTVKRIRTCVEQDLGLGAAFFKGDSTWNARSKDVIQSQLAAEEAQSQPPSSQPAPASSPVKKSKQSCKSVKVSNGKKRPQTSNAGPKKRHKAGQSDDENKIVEDVDRSPRTDVPSTGPCPSAGSSPLPEIKGMDEDTVDGTDNNEKTADNANDPGSESDLSSLIDECPKPKKRSRKASSEKPKPRKKEVSKSGKTAQQPTDPDTEEIKRLQGWLVKCGIRKMWFKELAPYDTPKAKIRHLKDMLAEAGMTGRYSQEKATHIREERELRADLADVQAGNKQWGKVELEDENGGKPRRRLARGLQELDFLGDKDGDDTD